MHGLQRSWARRGLWTRLLLPLAWLYGLAWHVRAALYRVGLRKSNALPVPVVVVGNLIAGGAGKTPTVRAVLELLRMHGWRPGVVSRGHGRRDGRVALVERDSAAALVGDEPLLLRLRGGVPVAVGRDRPAAARALLAAHPDLDVIVSDDGLQHLALARDVAVLVFDERGAGNGWLLPAGPLREPMRRALGPTDVVLYNAPAPSTPLPGFIAERRLAGAAPLAAWWAGEAVRMDLLDALRGRPLVAAAGLAQPQRFFDMLRAAGLAFEALPLPDHHDYATLPWPAATADVIVTEKDAVKLRAERVGATRVWVVALDFRSDARFGERLLQLLPQRRSQPAPMDDGHPTS
jgi:tetraacyldisaccharide 4'-kinase